MRGWPAAAALLAVLLSVACSQDVPKPANADLVIAVDAPLTGPQGPQGQAVVNAVNAVVAGEFRGRVVGLPVRVTLFDESVNQRRDPGQGERNVRMMLRDPHLVGVIGPLNSDVAVSEIAVANPAHLALISPSASHPCLTRNAASCGDLAAELRPSGSNDFFRLVPSDDGKGAALLEYARTTLHLTRFAVASDSQPAGKAVAESFEAAARRRGGNINIRRDLDLASDQAIDGFLAAAKAGGAEAVFVGGDQEGGACRVRARMKGLLDAATLFLAAGNVHGAACLRDAGPLAAGMYTADSGPADLVESSRLAARVLMRAMSDGVKGAGGNAPTREEVRAAISRSSNPAFDSHGDLRDQTFTIDRSDATPVWAAAGQVTVPSAG